MARLIEIIYESSFQGKVPCRTASQMEKLCCEPTNELECCEVSGPWDGYSAQEIADDFLKLELDAEGRNAKGEYVYIEFAERSQPCGEKLIKYDLTPHPCCDTWVPMVIDDDASPEVLPAGGSVLIFWDGGIPPYTVRTSSAATWLPDGYQSVDVDKPFMQIWAGPTFCGATVITIKDRCGSTQWVLRSNQGKWESVTSAGCVGGTWVITYPTTGWYSATVTNGQWKQTQSGWTTGMEGNLIVDPIPPECIPNSCWTTECPAAGCPSSYTPASGLYPNRPCAPQLRDTCRHIGWDAISYPYLLCSYDSSNLIYNDYWKWVC